MPARNMAATVKRALASVLSEPEVSEVIIVDDGSTDDTVSQAKSLCDPRIRILSGPQQGVAAALNMAFTAVKTEYVARCDADDHYQAGRLARQLYWLDRNRDFVAFSTSYCSVDGKGRTIAALSNKGTAREVTKELRKGEPVTHFCTFLTRTDAILSIGGARPWFRTASDIDLQLRLVEKGRIWHDPSINGYFYTLHENSITHRQNDMLRKFYDESARLFALQRLNLGQDDLMQGMPPKLPQIQQKRNALLLTARQHIAGQLEGTAWRTYYSGERKEAVRTMQRSVRVDPLSLSRWRGFLSMLVKAACRRP